MSVTAEGRKPTRRFAVGRALAPHVDEVWAESFCLELRMLGVEGARIGEALSEVESHCGESGRCAQFAFGTPVEYARSLRLPVEGEYGPRAVLGFLVPVSVQVLGIFLLIWSCVEWLHGQRIEVTTGHLVIATVFLLMVMASVRYAVSVLRLAVNHRRLFPVISVSFAFLAGTATCLFALRFLDQVLWRASGGWGLVAGAAALSGGILWAIVRRRLPGSIEDPITSPFDHEMRTP
jgi:hypothetical protein